MNFGLCHRVVERQTQDPAADVFADWHLLVPVDVGDRVQRRPKIPARKNPVGIEFIQGL